MPQSFLKLSSSKLGSHSAEGVSTADEEAQSCVRTSSDAVSVWTAGLPNIVSCERAAPSQCP